MKICEKCNKEFNEEMFTCPYCSQERYENGITISKTTNIISIVIIVIGTILALFVNGWAGAIACFIAEMISLIPNTKFTALFRVNNIHIKDRKALKSKTKELSKKLKLNNKHYKHSFVISSIALVLMTSFILFDFILPITDNNSSTSSETPTTTTVEANNNYYSEDNITTTENIVTTTENYSNQLQDEPIVGNWDYSYTCYSNGQTAYSTYPYISYLHLEADGTGNITWKDPSTPLLLSEMTWELYEVNDISGYTSRTYALHITNGFLTGETAYITWSDRDNNYCFTMNLSNNTYNFYARNTTVYNY